MSNKCTSDEAVAGLEETDLSHVANKYRYIEEGGFYSLTSARKSGHLTNLTFTCIKCSPKVKTINCQVGAESNLKRHIKTIHPDLLNEYEWLNRSAKY